MTRHAYAIVFAAILLLTGCDAWQEPPTPTPVATQVPPIPLNAVSGPVRASATIRPAHTAELSFAGSGHVTAIDVVVGDRVEAGTPLVRLDQTEAVATVDEAQAVLFKAQAALHELIDGPPSAEIAMAQAELEAAQARLAQVTERARPEDLEAARAELRAAQSAYQQLFAGPLEEERIAALATLQGAEATQRQAQSAYNDVAWQSNVGMLPESRALEEASIDLEAAQARYDALFAEPVVADIAAAQARMARAEAELQRLQNPGSASEVEAAQAQVRGAQAQLDLLVDGTRDDTVAGAAGTVAQAEAALARAQARLDALTLRAPIAGSVTSLQVNPGELVQAGEVVLVLADLTNLRAVTTDLGERDVARVEIGQPARVLVEALDQEIDGQVVDIAPQATVIGGDVVYAVEIDLLEPTAGLRWGMSADVEIRPRATTGE